MRKSELLESTRLPAKSSRPGEEPGEIAPRLVTLAETVPEPVSRELVAMRRPLVKELVPPNRLNSAVWVPSPTVKVPGPHVPALLWTRPWLKNTRLAAFTTRFESIKVPPATVTVP